MPEAENARPYEQLKESLSARAREDRYQAIVESAVDFAIFAMDLEGRVTNWNQGATRTLGWGKDEILGQLGRVIFTPEDQAEGRLEQEMQAALECDRAIDERWHQRKDGSRFWAVGELMPLRTEAGEVDGFVKILRDRTAQHQQEERLRAQASTLRTITDHVSEAVFQLDADGNVTFANAAAQAMFGWSAKELLGRNLHEALHHHYADGRPYPAKDCRVVAALGTGEVLRDHEEVFFRQDGTPRQVLCTNAPVRVDGQINSTVLTVTDVTERKQADAALADTSRRLNAVLDNATVAVFLMDDRQHCVYMNAAAERLTGYTFAETQGRPLHDVIHHTRPDGSHFPLHECAIDRAFPENTHTQGEEIFVHKDGHFYPVAFRAGPVLDDEDKPIGIVIEARDIAEEKARDAALRENAERLAITFDKVQVGICETGLDGRFRRVNAAFAAITGYGEGELIGRHFADLTHPDDRERSAAALPLLVSGEARVYRAEKRYVRPDGATVWVALQSAIVSDSKGAPLYALSTIQDITERKDAETALQASVTHFRHLADQLPQIVWQATAEGENSYLNRRWYEFTGELDGAEDPGGWRAYLHPDDVEPSSAAWQAALSSSAPFETEYRLKEVRTGVYRWQLGRAVPVRDSSGAITHWLGTCTDIHDQRQAELGRRAAEERQAFLLTLADCLRGFESPHEITAAAAEMLGEQLRASRVGYGEVDEAHDAITGERDWTNGTVPSITGRFSLSSFGPELVTMAKDGLTVRVEDVQAEPRIGEALGAYKAIGVAAFLSVPLVKDGHLRAVLSVHQDQPRGWSDAEVALTEEVAERTWAAVEQARAETALRKLNATLEQRVEERTAELRTTEEALRQSQKMEAVGQLTGGLAHDFNNLLTGISGSLELLQTRMAQGRLTDLERYINAAQGAARRAAALTHRLLAFSRRQTLDPKSTDVNGLIFGMEELVRRTVGPEIAVEVVGAAGLWPALVDPPQLENALLNLCINARDAMPEGGRITIETANKWLDDRAAKERDLPPGQYLSLCVTDTGTGMTPEVIARAFDPFFTTKPIGQGTGLGLSMIYGFVRQSGGQVRIYSELGQGTTMCLYLPRHYGKAEEAQVLAGLSDAPRAEQGETVLIVDDEPSVRMLVTEVLEDLGYTAIEAADGPSGLKVLQSDVRIDLLVTDVGLPGGMNGRQMADAGRLVRPGLRVLFITGYAENAAVGNGHLEPGMQVLTKPFVMETLASRIREMIESKA